MKWILALVAVFVAASTAVAQPVADFPDISGKCYLTVVYNDYSTPLEKQLKTALYNPGHQLFSLREQCVFNEWSNGDEVVQKTDWAIYLGDKRPVLLLQGKAESDDSADIIFVASGSELHNLDRVVANIGLALKHYQQWLALPTGQRGRWQPQQRCDPEGCFPRGQRGIDIRQQQQTDVPKRKVEPITKVVVDLPSVDIDVDTGPGEEPTDEDEDNGFPLWLLIFPIAGGAAGIASHLRNQS